VTATNDNIGLTPRDGDIVLCCSLAHISKQMQVWPLVLPVFVQRQDSKTKITENLQASFVAACPACCLLYRNEPAQIFAHARGHFTWGEAPSHSAASH